ncbi:MAG: hypothetical protein A2Z34_00410 [Planctomycetes bacterium RBG_16_59_8]|nr:MAG: hypothetical protein A2Z34_00410 [Planctomycetes bacterium RBG_16_59_8]
MKVKFWGVRGSIPCPGTRTAGFGGNTSCVQVLDGKNIIILDAGTGIRELGLELVARDEPLVVHMLISHTHWDHIQGFPFFLPIFNKRNRIYIYGPRALRRSIKDVLLWQMQYSYFPILGAELAAGFHFRDVENETFAIGNLTVSTHVMNHPIKVIAYRVADGGKSVLYTGDNEPYNEQQLRKFGKGGLRKLDRFVKGTDLLIADAQYTDAEYEYKKGWGHSTISQAINLAAANDVRKLAFFHHEPTHGDADLRWLEKAAVRYAAERSRRLKVFMAREREILTV